MKILIFLIPFLVGCSSFREKPIAFPEMKMGVCSDLTNRGPDSVCKKDLGGEDFVAPMDEHPALKSFESAIKNSDHSQGRGFSNASFYIPTVKEPLRQGSPDSSFWQQGQAVSFYETLNARKTRNRGGSVVQGTPTRVYLTPEGEVAYLGFDKQSVALYEFTAYMDDHSYSPIRGQGIQQHPTGFSAPVGKIKKLAYAPSEYTIDELRVLLGKEGDEVSLEFESGVVVKGIIEKYTALEHSNDPDRAVVITFRDKTCTVTYGVHTLFRPAWGVFDMLLMPVVSDSLTAIPQHKP